jgi:hypothetical protein
MQAAARCGKEKVGVFIGEEKSREIAIATSLDLMQGHGETMKEARRLPTWHWMSSSNLLTILMLYAQVWCTAAEDRQIYC